MRQGSCRLIISEDNHAHYSLERKEAILQKMAPPHSLTVAELASQEGISTATLYNWRKAARKRGAVLPSNAATPDKWSSEEKFRIVLERSDDGGGTQ